ncbi:hypothetical protein C7T94_03915 [Pedobacter yulinensis]|uniref:Uncharacterized protein n=1 Tax=Pedobacter yulinensis TaxID=2126353 RepID=A0A2T3HN67_9SPHI|nr:hypothetical protein [Pedobacter yulinensis]PST83902.1 hypothetical protein C7T94_03915 [Pedobacter yulinensis]
MMNKFMFNDSGIRTIDIEFDAEAISHLRNVWQKSVPNFPEFPSRRFSGKGIVIAAGGLSYLTCTYITLKNLRRSGCKLPVEVWHLSYELSEEMCGLLESLDAKCRVFNPLVEKNFNSVALKPLAIIESSFEEVLYLDADNLVLRDPTYLFTTEPYKQFGQIFWPDFWRTDINNPIFKVMDCEGADAREHESGQLLVDKRRCWQALNLALTINKYHAIFYHLVYGDKDTFKFAWLALRKEYYLISTPVASMGYYSESGEFHGLTMGQSDDTANLLFLHRNMRKWDATLTTERIWKVCRSVQSADVKFSMPLGEDGTRHLHIGGDVVDLPADPAVIHLESSCINDLQELRALSSYQLFVLQDYIRTKRGLKDSAVFHATF